MRAPTRWRWTRLREGELVGVYPEATISRSFELKDFKTGAARMAIEAQVPIIPLIVWGAQRVWTKDHPRNAGPQQDSDHGRGRPAAGACRAPSRRLMRATCARR